MPEPDAIATTWSGAVLVMFSVPLVVMGLPVTAMPVPAVAATEVTVPAPKFVRAPAAVVAPVPPLATAKVPASVMVPADVIGPPLVVKPVVPPDTSTDVTVPNALSPPPLGGPICKSSNEVALLPPPVRLNRFKKNRYHSRDINPVRGSMKSTRDEGMLVMLV